MKRPQWEKVLFSIVFLVLSLFLGDLCPAESNPADLNLEDLLRKVDHVRTPNTDFSVDVMVQTESNTRPPQTYHYEVKVNSE